MASDWFCNAQSAEGLCVVHVTAGSAVAFSVKIDYEAAY
jgi:hypothetical protein